jgi:hypothetical protein
MGHETLELFGDRLLAAVLGGQRAGRRGPALKDLRAKWEAMSKEFKDLTIQQEMNMAEGPRQGPMQITIMCKGAKTRTEMNVQGMTMITIFDGTDA